MAVTFLSAQVGLGVRHDKYRVRKLELPDGKILHPPYGKEPRWSEVDGDYIEVEGIRIPKGNTQDTYMQCDPSLDPNYVNLSSKEFLQALREKFPNPGVTFTQS